MLSILNLTADISSLFFPHFCIECGEQIEDRSQMLCILCQLNLPYTNFFDSPGNLVERSFYGRLNIEVGAAAFYFTKNGTIQTLISELKYKENAAAGIFLGRLMGYQLKNSERYKNIDLLLPMPLHPKKLKKRGYNQASILCEGIQLIWNKPIIEDAIIRIENSNSQTLQDRLQRWENMSGIFCLQKPELLYNKHVLLVDDVTTTGASLEALGAVLQSDKSIKISVATAAYTL